MRGVILNTAELIRTTMQLLNKALLLYACLRYDVNTTEQNLCGQ